MTIQDWMLVSDAVIIGLLSVGGFWLRYFVNQQLGAKDAAIAALDSALKAKDAQISRLEAESSPAIAKTYSDMREYAKRVSEDLQRSTEELEGLRRQNEAALSFVARQTQFNEKVLPYEDLLRETDGLLLASGILLESFNGFFQSAQPPEVSAVTLQKYIDAFFESMGKIHSEISARSTKLDSMSDALPKPKNLLGGT